MSIYLLKPRFQSLLRPSVRQLHRAGVTANQVTVAAALVSVALGLGLYASGAPAAALLLVPAWQLARMAFNAVDGMLAREHGQASRLGACLNELTDPVADAALALPLALVAPLQPLWVAAFVVMACLSEMAGLLGPTIGASRRYDGPMGKSDRAAAVGVLCFCAALAPLPSAAAVVMPALTVLTALTVVQRVRLALREGAR
ncbi:MAG: CDP-alcohol phosphatidyltransferase family protein [Rubrivivax sp.]